MYAEKLYQRFLKAVSKRRREITPKTVHLLRTTSRRLQMALAASTEADDKLRRQLRKIRRQAGRVRDLDVQLATLKSIKTPAAAAEQKKVKRELEHMRERRARKLRQFLREYTPGLRQPQKATESEVRAPQHPLHAALDTFSAAAANFGSGTSADLHAFRIAAKKVRYTVELAENEPDAASAIVALKAIQNAIGEWHDWAILAETAARVLGNPQHSPLINVLHKKVQTRLSRASRVTAENTKRLLELRATLSERIAVVDQKKRPASVKLRQRAARAL